MATDIYKYTYSDHALEKYKACVLLGELTLDPEMLNKIREDLNKTGNICRYYLLARRSGEHSDIIRYIERFPSGEQQKPIWNAHFDAGFPVSFPSPYFVLIANQAGNNDLALDKLISGIPYADASFGAVLMDTLANLYKRSPERVYQRLKAQKISKKDIEFIIRTANHSMKVK